MIKRPIAESLVENLRGGSDIGQSILKTKFEILLRGLLSIVATNVGLPILIVLDGLDECGTPETRQKLIDVLYHRYPPSTIHSYSRLLPF